MSVARGEPWFGVDSDNLTGLAELNEESLLRSVKQRYNGDSIYSDVGDILVAVNPFRSLPMYDKVWSQAYNRPDVSALAPHIYRVAARAFNSMVQGKKNQVCVISGESGAGKTESAKYIMHQVMGMSRSAGLGQKLQEKVIQLNPLLEAFGNAQTALNDNSSRFGKYIQLMFEPNGRIVGAGLEQYLLEKSRVCVQGEQERNFHIFYYFYAGLAPKMIQQLHLKSPTEHRYLRSYKHLLADCNSAESKEAFHTVMESMSSIGFEEEEIHHVLTILAAIIHIGDIEFVGVDGGEDGAQVRNPEQVELVSQLLQLESSQELAFALTTLRTTTRGETVDKQYSCSKAANVRDAIAKALYARMFNWIVARLNGYLQPYPSPDHLNIGILDIFGFENFDQNSFEQFCINLANEQLQQYFNHQIFAMEKVEYAKEGLDGLEISYRDNKPVLDLFLNRPIGLLSLLDEQCRGLNGTEKAFVQRCRESFAKHSSYVPHRGDALVFTVKHYAGDVEYEAGRFLEKNKDSLPEMVVAVLKFSSLHLVRVLFVRHPSPSRSQLRKSILRKSQRSVMRAMSRRRRPSMKKPGANKKLLTVSAHFRDSLNLLMERVFAASPHFVRCIKPNMDKLPKRFDDEFVVRQLRYTGMLEAVRVRREGFAYRPFFSDFFECYKSLAYHFTDNSVRPSEAACRVILDQAGIAGWRIGKSRVFLRYFHEERLQLLLKDLEDKAILIQRVFRGHSTRKWTRPLRERQKQEKAMVADFLSTLGQKGQERYPTLVSLNTVDIKLAVKRFGHKRQKKETALQNGGLEGEDVSEEERKRRRAQKLGVAVPFGLALSTESGTAIPALKRVSRDDETSRVSSSSQQQVQKTASGSVESSQQDIPDTSVTIQHRYPDVEPHTSRTKSQTSVSDVNLESPVYAFDERPHSGEQRATKHPVGGVRLLPELQPLPAVHPKPSPVHTAGTRLQKTDEQRPGTAEVETNTSRPPSGVSNSSLESPVHYVQRSDSNSSSEQRMGRQPVGGVKLLPEVQGFPLSPSRAVLKQRDSGLKQYQGNHIDGITTNHLIVGSLENPGSRTLPYPSSKSNASAKPSSISVAESTATLRQPLTAYRTSGQSSLDFGPGESTLDLLPRRSSEPLSSTSQSGSTYIHTNTRGPFSTSTLQSGGQAPQADKRLWKVGFTFGRHKAVKKQRGHSSSSVRSSDVPTSPPPVGEKPNVLGFYHNLTSEGALEMVSGQPKGTFVVYRENSRIYTDQPRWDPTYQLVVSGGRSVHIFSIVSSSHSGSTRYRMDSTDPQNSFADLKALLQHYRKVELQEGLYLLQPRLLAGVSVTGVRLVSKNRTGSKGRLGFRKKS